jgi:hypothetical protein
MISETKALDQNGERVSRNSVHLRVEEDIKRNRKNG